MKEQQLIKKIRRFAEKQYARSTVAGLSFHTYKRSEKFVVGVKILAEPFGLSEADRIMLYAAAWLQNIGYTVDPADAQTQGLRLANDLLLSLEVDQAIIDGVNKLLMIDPRSYQPTDQLEEIICDAGTCYLAKRSLMRSIELHRKERSVNQRQKINRTEWLKNAVGWIADHRYYTAKARVLWEEKKQRNLTRLKTELLDTSGSCDDPEVESTTARPVKKPKNTTEKSIDTMFKVASANNQRISAMADNKSRILITVNAIILSAIVSLVLKKLEQDTYLAYPTFLLIGVSLVSIVFAILAIRPHMTRGTFSAVQLENKEVNLLFYGNFHRMNIIEFRKGMLQIMEDNEQVYGSLIDDLFGQGSAVGRKYRLLRVAYTVFMFGLVTAMLAFIIVTIIHYQAAGTAAALPIKQP